MIDPDKCSAVYLLHTEGMGVREISRRLNLSRNTVRRIIKQQGMVPVSPRKDKTHIESTKSFSRRKGSRSAIRR
jgi:DNA-binding transcriptional regulator LsrR (DeoR family)